jgi:uncharacterized protein YdaU (DUF1376 family)
MKFSVIALFVVSIGVSVAFQPPAIIPVAGGRVQHQHVLMMSSAAVAEKPVAAASPAKKLTLALVRRHIDRLSKKNFAATLATLEPFFLHEAKGSFYAKCMHRLERNAKTIGATMPEKYAYDAACTAKRRTKQDEYIKTKFPPPAAAEEAEESPAESAN